MFSTDAIIRRGTVVLACALGLGGAAIAQTIVVKSSGPSAKSYPVGKSLAPGAKIVLAKGDSLTVLDSRGTRTLSGPGNFGADASSATANQSFTSLVATQNRRRARTGAVRELRNGSQRVMPPSLWFIDIGRSTTFCVADANAVQLWRPDMQQAVTLTVTDQNGRTSTIAFPIGQNNVPWPTAALPVADGNSYTLSGAGLAKPVKLRFAMLGAPVNDPVDTYTALESKGCADQKDLLITATNTDQTRS